MSELDLQLDKAGAAFEQASTLANDIAGWEEVSSDAQMTAYKRMTSEGINAIKMSCYLEKPFVEMADYAFRNWIDFELNLGDMMAHMEVIKTYEDGSMLRLERTKPMGPVSPREAYIYTSKQQIDEDNVIVLSTSSALEHPLSDGHVRPNIPYILHMYKPIGNDRSKTHVTFVDLVDPRGNIPHLIVNNVVTDRIKFYSAVIERLKTL